MIIIHPLSITYELSPRPLKELSRPILPLLAETNGVELRLDVTTAVEQSRGFRFDKLPSKCSCLHNSAREIKIENPYESYRVYTKLKDLRSKYQYSCMRLSITKTNKTQAYLGGRIFPSVGKWRRNSANSLLVAPSKPRIVFLSFRRLKTDERSLICRTEPDKRGLPLEGTAVILDITFYFPTLRRTRSTQLTKIYPKLLSDNHNA